MNLLAELLGPDGAVPIPTDRIVAGLLISFVLGQVCAWMYMYTHAGVSYSKAFVQSIVLLSIIVALSMMVIGNNLVAAFGLIGALAVIRFRNILKDTRDTAFIFFSLIVGMACGTFSFRLAFIGTLLFSLVLAYLHWADFGSLHTGDGFLRMHVRSTGSGADAFLGVLRRYCRDMVLVSQRLYEGDHREVAYRLTMRDPQRANELVASLNALEGLSHVTLVLQEEESEI